MAIEDSVLLIDIDVVFMQLLTVITTIDDLNYPEKTLTYYIVNAPYVFSACWKVHLPAFYSDWSLTHSRSTSTIFDLNVFSYM